MSYTSYDSMKKINAIRFGHESGPVQPPFGGVQDGYDLKSAALRFIREGCEELRFSGITVEEEVSKGIYRGTGLSAGQVPYNMQMDTDRLCLEKALEGFINSGVAEDAYEVYYCYLEMFIGAYSNSKAMVELLSEFETNGSSLLMKHRDHYSHSVYVFALGLAIYETNAEYRNGFKKFYGISTDEKDRKSLLKANHLYLEFWGLTALFHDIGYPFELPFEQLMSYFEIDKAKRVPGIPFIAFRDLDGFTVFSEEEQRHFLQLYGKTFHSVPELLAYDITEKLSRSYGFSGDYMLQQISDKPVNPENHNYFMDHAFFSAVRLLNELIENKGIESIGKIQVDALSAIMLHNSLFKFSIAFYKDQPPKKKQPLKLDEHPLAFMLMLCDELQCWDRTAYGRSSRSLLYPMSADFDFSDGAIKAYYHYDNAENALIERYYAQKSDFDAGITDKKPRLKAFSDMTGKNDFVSEIKEIVDLNKIPFTAEPDTRPADRSRKHTYLSGSSFIHMYDFAVALSARRLMTGNESDLSLEQYYEKFDSSSLEYRVINLRRARSFSRYLNKIHCFYTDRPVDFRIIENFTQAQLDVIAPMEHERWITDHAGNGWIYGNDYQTCAADCSETDEKSFRKCLREQSRTHILMPEGKITPEDCLAHFEALPSEEQGKDFEPFNSMLRFIHRLDGVKIYSLDD